MKKRLFAMLFAFLLQGILGGPLSVRAAGESVFIAQSHGEILLAPSFYEEVEAQGAIVKELDVSAVDVPDSCAFLVIFAPTRDLTAEEAGRIRYYLGEGGNAMIFSNPEADTPNLDRILASYGMSRSASQIIPGEGEQLTALGRSDLSFYQAQTILTQDKEEATYAAMPLLGTNNTAALDGVTDSHVVLVRVEESFISTSHGEADVPLPETATEQEGVAGMTRLLYGTAPSLFSEELYREASGGEILPASNEALLKNCVQYLLQDTETSAVQAPKDPSASASLRAMLPAVAGAVLLLAAGLLFLRITKKGEEIK